MIKHHRGLTEVGTLFPLSAVLKKALSGVFVLEFELHDVSDVYVGDSIEIEWNGETLTFVIREINERQVTAEHKSYILRNYAVVDKYLNTPPTYDSLIEFADISLDEVITFLNPLFADAGFSISNSSVSSERKDITFNGDNLLSAIQKVCNTFKVEFVSHDGYIQIVDQYGIDTGLTINAGIHTESIKKRIDRSNIVTRIYPIGSAENLPEGYYYTALRPTTFDLTTKTHTGNLYVDNTEAQQNYGIIEKVVEFSHVKVKSKRGTVSGTGSAAVQELENKTYPYVYDANMNIPDPDKAKSATLFVKNGLKAAELPIVHIDTTNKRIYYNPTLRDGSTLSWTPEVGSEYILVGYITQDEMNAARDELIAEAQRYLEENADPKVSYEIANLYIPDGKVFDVGDSLHLKDDSAGIDTTVRVLEFAYDLVSKVYRALKLSNTKEKLPYDIIREQAEQKRQIEQIKLQVSESWQTARDALERHNLLVRNNFYGSENEYLLIGSTARNYVLKGLTITPDDGTAGKVSWTGFTFQHINETTEYTCGSGNQQLSVGTYYLYIQIKLSDPANSSGMNTLVFSSTPLENSGELNYYALGMAEFDGTRTKVAVSYGFTLIDGNFIKTGTILADKLGVNELSAISANAGTITAGTIQGSTGTTKFDLNNDRIDVGNGLVKIGKGVLSGGGDGILLNAANLEVDGEIAARYIRLTDSAIVNLDEWDIIIDAQANAVGYGATRSWSADVLTTRSVYVPTNLLKTYIQRVPVRVYVYIYCDFGSVFGGFSYWIYLAGQLIASGTETVKAGSIEFTIEDIFQNYSAPLNSTLQITVKNNSSSSLANFEVKIGIPKTYFIVQAI